jgi:uncharacterized membrane protein
VNYDGTVVVGDDGAELFMWTEQNGAMTIGGVAPQGYGGRPDVSADGSKIAGTSINPSTGLGELSIYDVASGLWTNLGGIGGSSGNSTSSSWGISQDGTSVVGLGWVNAGSAHAIQWTAATGMVDLGSTVSGSSSRANDCNGDGSVVVGWQDSTTGFRQGAIWVNGVQQLLTHPGGGASEAGCVSFDGTFVGGSGSSSNNYEAWRYNINTGMENIGPPPVNGWRGATTGLSDDGSVVVGFYRPWPAPATQGQGFYYKDGVGIQDLNQLASDLGIDTQGRTLALPLGVSGDGTTVVGLANDGTGFVIRLAESTAINDNCTNATLISCNETLAGSTTNATDSGGNGTNDVFYKYVGDGETQMVTASLCNGNTNFDTVIRVYDNCDLTNEIASNDDFCGVQSAVTFESDGVSSYFIMIEGTNDSGDFEVTIDCTNIMSVDQNAFVNFALAPNPARENVSVRNALPMDRISIYNIMGQNLMSLENAGLEQSISIKHLTPGVYFVTAEIQGAKHTVPVVKQ